LAGSYYVKTTVKLLLNIPTAQTSEDTLLDLLGALADQHIDNILKIHDEKIPLQGANVLNDIIMAANFYTASLYKARREDPEMAKHWMNEFNSTIEGIKAERKVENLAYLVNRHPTTLIGGTHDHYNESGFYGG
jgi:hypothetical protein